MTGTLVEGTIAAALDHAVRRLTAAGIDEPRREARLLLAAALRCDATAVIGYPERRLTAADEATLAGLLSRRAAREPAARLLGRREFWSLDFFVSPDTLVPRPDSETVIEAVLAAIPRRDAALRLLDFGTGTGCLLLALLSELPAASGIGVDLAPGAVATARKNALSLGLADRASFVVGSWGEAISGAFDVIVANPPYIVSQAIDGLAPEVARYEPRLALDGGFDGLAAYRLLAPEAARRLRPDGIAVFEVGAGQATRVAEEMRQAGLKVCGTRRDLAAIERCIVAAGRTVRADFP
jgi:release factor glutamine methyltransferase